MTIDERLQFLLQSTESLHDTVQGLTGQVQALVETARLNERRWQRTTRVVRAALKASLDNGDEPEEGETK